jgi:hypothetical protein
MLLFKFVINIILNKNGYCEIESWTIKNISVW